jgi:hypothetical protein
LTILHEAQLEKLRVECNSQLLAATFFPGSKAALPPRDRRHVSGCPDFKLADDFNDPLPDDILACFTGEAE